MTIAIIIIIAIGVVTVAWAVGRREGRQQGMDATADAAGDIAREYIDMVLAKSTDSQHHSDLHTEIDMLRMALAEANRRLADTGVTISVEEIITLTDMEQAALFDGDGR